MPKPMMMMIECEEIAFGRVFRTLDTMPGVASIKIMGNGAKIATGPGKGNRTPGTRAKGSLKDGTSGRCIVLNALTDGPKSLKDINELMVAAGKSPKTLHGQSHMMLKLKLVKKTGKGILAITAAGKKYLETKCNIGESI
jgi:hypothetical protein